LQKSTNVVLNKIKEKNLNKNFSFCCCPILNEQCFGLIVSKKNIIIHTQDCIRTFFANKDFLSYVKWENLFFNLF